MQRDSDDFILVLTIQKFWQQTFFFYQQSMSEFYIKTTVKEKYFIW